MAGVTVLVDANDPVAVLVRWIRDGGRAAASGAVHAAVPGSEMVSLCGKAVPYWAERPQGARLAEMWPNCAVRLVMPLLSAEVAEGWLRAAGHRAA